MDLDAVAGLHDDYRTLIDFWRAKKPADEPAPRFRDIDLMDLYTIAARLIIVDVETGAGSDRVYRWRYAGSALRDFIGIELTGRYLHDTADAATTRDTSKIYAEIAQNGGHHYWERKLGLKDEDRSFLSYSRLILPLLGGDGAVRHFIALYVLPQQTSAREDHKPQTWDLVPDGH